jgi:DNA-binding NarL/FixJ family response regulator
MLRKPKCSLLNTEKPETRIGLLTGLSLIAQYVDGSTVIEVAHKHKLTVKEVSTFLRQVNVLNNRPKPIVKLSDRDFDIVNLAALGISALDIAKDFSISVVEVKLIISNNSTKEGQRKLPPETYKLSLSRL